MIISSHKKSFISVVLCFYIAYSPFFVQSSFAENTQDVMVVEQIENAFISPFVSKDIAAQVNGENITVYDVLGVYSAGTFTTNMSLPQSVEAVRNDFSIILQDLITYELVRQELDRRKIFVTDIDIQRAEQELRAPYAMRDELERAKRMQASEAFSGLEAEKNAMMQSIENLDTFSESLLERGLTAEQWRAMLTRQLHTQIFMKQVLEPTIHITPDEIEAAYRAYPELMLFDKHVQYRLFSVASDDVADQIMHAIQEDGSTQLADISGYFVEDFLMPYDRFSDAWVNVVHRAEKAFEANSDKKHYSEIIDEDDGKKILSIQKILPARTLSLGEAYVRLERLLMEQKLAAAYGQWLEHAWQSADIRLAPQLSLTICHDDERKLSQESVLK